MITKDEIQELLHSTETYRVEQTTSTGNLDKFQEAFMATFDAMPCLAAKLSDVVLFGYKPGHETNMMLLTKVRTT